MPFLNSIYTTIGSQRLRTIAKFADNADDIQTKQLECVLAKARHTVIGSDYDFGSIRSHADFASRVPVCDYVGFTKYVERMKQGESDVCWPGVVRWFAKSSGTTDAKSKFIPVTSDALHHCHYKGAIDTTLTYLAEHPESKMLSGKCLTLGGSKEISHIDKRIQTGDLSAILIGNAPWLSNYFKTPCKEIALLAKWEEKLEKITAACAGENVTSMAGVPSWFLILLKHMLDVTGKSSIHEMWPNLELFIHGGINFTPYRQQYVDLCPKGINFQETYNASEGFFGIQTSQGADMQLMLDYGVFYEFVPIGEIGSPFPKAYTVADVEIGVDYAMVISTNGGLWRYMIGDTVRFTSLRPHRFVITGRTKHYINAFGEELMIANAEYGLRKACEQTGAVIKEYTAAPVFMDIRNQGCHEWLVEFEKMPSDIQLFGQMLDDALREVNSDYDAKRYKGITLGAPRITVARDGLFFSWMESVGKLGGQNKVPRLSNNRELIDKLLKLN